MAACASCGTENPDGAKFCMSCGAPQGAPPCPNCGEQNPPQAKFCLNCGTALTAAAAPPPPPPPPAPEPVLEEERKLDTLVFVDLVGSTALAESLDPEDVLHLLEMYYTRLRAELERHGGTVEKYIGDAIVTHFGVPVGHEDDPERAVRAALDILDKVVALNAEDPIRRIEVRIGIHTGEVIVRHGNRAEEGKGIAWGDALNTAARIESAAPAMGILVGEETYRASRHAIEYREHEPIEAKGKAEPVQVWEVVGVRASAARGRAQEAPFVGRDAELDRLLALWDGVQADGRPALGMVIAEPGVGKSRLVTETTTRLGESATVLWGRCLSYGEGITYWPVIEILEGAAGILVSDQTEQVSDRLGALLESLGADDPDQLRTMASALANLIGVPRTPHGTYSATEMSQAELHWGIRRVLELLATQRPLALVFEDLHWAEPTLLDLIDFIGEAEAPILLLGSGRPELASIRPAFATDGEHRAALHLSALDEAASERLLAELLGTHELPDGQRADQLLRNAGGNPLFLEETVRMLADAGALDGGKAPVDIAVPTTLQAMIGARLDALATGEKRVAQHASVVGMVFWSGAVAELEGSEADPRLQTLEQRDFLHAHPESSLVDEREWEFKHALIKDVAYGRVPKSRRANLHVRFVDWLGSHPAAGEELVEIVAYHLEQSCKLAREVSRSEPPPIERAVDALMRAAEKAERREGIHEADRYFARALDLLGDEESVQALEVRLGRAGTLQTLGELGKSDEVLTGVAEAALGTRPDLRARALIERANIAAKQGRGAEARAFAAEAESIAAGYGDRSLEARAIYRRGYVRWWFESAGEAAIADIERALAIAEELDDQALQVEISAWLASLLYNLGELGRAEERLMRCFGILGNLGSLRDEARATWLLALVKYHRGRVDEAETLALRSLDWFERTGDRFYHLQALRLVALCAGVRGKHAVAEERLRDAVPIALEIGGALVVEVYRLLVDVLVRQDRLDDARELAVFAFQSVPPEDGYCKAACLLIEGTLRTAEGRRDVVEQSYAEAVLLLEQQRLPIDVAEARLAYGRALRELGGEVEAREQLRLAREDLARMGAQGLVDEIDSELVALNEGAG
jgi:class 3 adenylate cyclase/tetratricopeptide (TPR) repeat protein